MNEEGQDIFDSLGDTDFSEVDTSMPVLAANVYEFEVKSIERKEWASGEGSSLVINLSLNQDAEDVSGEREISPGYPVTDRISLVAKGRYDPRQAVARFLEALGMKDEPFDKTFQSYIGQTLQAKTKVEQERELPDGRVIPQQTAIASYLKVK